MRFSISFCDYRCWHIVAPAVQMRTERAGSMHIGTRASRTAVDRICGNALFRKVLQGFSVNYQKMRSIGIWAPCGGRTAAGGTREPMVSHWFFNDSGSTPALPSPGGGSAGGTHRQTAVDRNCGNALFYNVFHGFSVKYQKVRSIGFFALRALCRKYKVFHSFLTGSPWRTDRIPIDRICCQKVWNCKLF